MSKLNIYQEQQILTAPPQQLVLLMYNRAIVELKRTLQMDTWESRKPHIQKTQDILFQLMTGCVTEMELGKNFYMLYDFYVRYLSIGLIRKEEDRLHKTLSFFEEMRDTWQEAMKRVKVS